MKIEAVKNSSRLQKRMQTANATYTLGFVCSFFALMAGVVVYEISHSLFILIAACFLMSIYNSVMIVLFFLNKGQNLLRLTCNMTLLWYLFPLSYISIFGLEDKLIVGMDDLVSSVFVISVSVLILWVLSFFINIRADLYRVRSSVDRGMGLMLFVAPLVAVQIGLLLTGEWTFGSLSVSASGINFTSGISIFMTGCTAGIAPICSLYFGRYIGSKKKRSSMLRYLLLFIAVESVQLFWWFLAGRRFFAIIIILTVLAFLNSVFQSKIRLKHVALMALLGIVCVPIMFEAGKVFFALRQSSYAYDVRSRGAVSFLDLLERTNALNETAISANYLDNILLRPFIIQSVAVFYSKATGNLWGKELASQIIVTIPGLIFPGKNEYVKRNGTAEDIWANDLGVPPNDYANTLLLDGFADFSYFGFSVYSIICALIFASVVFVSRTFGSEALALYAGFCIIFNFASVETQLAAFFGTARSLLIVLLITLVVKMVLSLRNRSVGRMRLGLRIPRSS